MVRLTTFLKAKIVVLWEQEQSIKKIARDMGITRKTVRRWIQRYQATGDVKCDRNFDWENEIVIFTDGKCFKSDQDGRKILWRRHGQRFNPKNVLDLRTSGPLTLGYWGWMSSMGSGELVEIGGRMNSERYLEVLKDVMLPYEAIKKKCMVDRGVPSQVIISKNMTSKSAKSVATRVAIQINCKLGGAPWRVDIPLQSLLVIGYDVCHDTRSKEKSFGGFVATLDRHLTRYYSAVNSHSSGEELSAHMGFNVAAALRRYRDLNDGNLPERIFIYRDGVSDGNIPYVHSHEVAEIKKKLAEVYGELEYKMAFIIVSKRINTRIFLDRGNTFVNPRPGTVIDDVITQPERYDFFLVSQNVREGTISPTSYNVIDDNTGLHPDKMQRLTYKLTHLYFNCPSQVSVPAVCQYAHKLAYLAANSLHSQPHYTFSDTLYFL